MKKLKLNLDEIKVESFETVQSIKGKGTVIGNLLYTASQVDQNCEGTGGGGGGGTLINTCINCITVPATCAITCADTCNTCDWTCYDTCNNSCFC